MKKANYVFLLLMFCFSVASCMSSPAEKKKSYVFSAEPLKKNNIVINCPCDFFEGWRVSHHHKSHFRVFRKRFSDSLRGRISPQYNFYGKKYKKNKRAYSDDAHMVAEYYSEDHGHDGGMTQYESVDVRPLYPGSKRECVYIEKGSSLHGRLRADLREDVYKPGLHTRNISCALEETEVRDGIVIQYSLNVLPGYEKGGVSPAEAMREIEETVEALARAMKLEQSSREKSFFLF